MSKSKEDSSKILSSPKSDSEKDKRLPSEITPAKTNFNTISRSSTKKYPCTNGSLSNKKLSRSNYSKRRSRSLEVSPKSTENTPRVITRTRIRKRKRSSCSSSNEEDLLLPENAGEVERKLQETAQRNNLTDDNVKKILKKVVTNDHVLALVALREEEETKQKELNMKEITLTRAKAKELTKTSPVSMPGTAPWNIELTPIKHIPVKTRPEVRALIAQELPDESDEEYQPTLDDVPSDDETLESCSDVDSQPRTPATPASLPPASPQPEPVTDGPFKIPMVRIPVKRQPESEEEATIALRTRSKLCLSATPIESIEESFVPPDEAPRPRVDALWSDFLDEVLNPNTTSFRTEEDDEADPEYNAAADPDADDDDEEALERSLVNISRKELDDLIQEVFGMQVPDPIPIKVQPSEQDEQPNVNEFDQSTQRAESKVPGHHSSTEAPRMPIPMKEESDETEMQIVEEREGRPPPILRESEGKVVKELVRIVVCSKDNRVTDKVVCEEVVVEEGAVHPPRLLALNKSPAAKPCPDKVNIVLKKDAQSVIEPGQIQILQQQLRQHVQLIASTYLQIYVHPKHWSYAPPYKEYLVSLVKMAEDRLARGQRSVVDVCNLRPALELLNAWEDTMSENTPQNQEMIRFLEKEVERCNHRSSQNVLYVGNFSSMYQEVVSNSSVFLYPYLLPPVPFRSSSYRRQTYLRSEDNLIAMGLEQFYDYVSRNTQLYKKRQRTGVNITVVAGLIAKHMLPWVGIRPLMYHIQISRKHKDETHPIRRFFERKPLERFQHKLLAFNPNITLHQQPEYEMPLKWANFLSRHNEKAKQFVMQKKKWCGHEPNSVDVDIENKHPVEPPYKKPRPLVPTREAKKKLNGIVYTLTSLDKNKPIAPDSDKPLPKIAPKNPTQLILPNGGILVPVMILPADGTVNCSNSSISIAGTKEVNSNNCMNTPTTSANEIKSINCINTPIPSVKEVQTNSLNNVFEKSLPTVITEVNHNDIDSSQINVHVMSVQETSQNNVTVKSHCECCKMMRNLQKKWTLITNYFKKREKNSLECCVDRKGPKVNQRLKCFIDVCKTSLSSCLDDIDNRLSVVGHKDDIEEGQVDCGKSLNLQDELWARAYLCKLSMACQGDAGKKILYHVNTFRVGQDDPVELYTKLYKDTPLECRDELVLLMSEHEADRLGLFPQLFALGHLPTLVDALKREVKDERRRRTLVSLVCGGVRGRGRGACALCVRLLETVGFSRTLSELVYRATPHAATPAGTESPVVQSNGENDEIDMQTEANRTLTEHEDMEMESLAGENDSENECSDSSYGETIDVITSNPQVFISDQSTANILQPTIEIKTPFGNASELKTPFEPCTVIAIKNEFNPEANSIAEEINTESSLTQTSENTNEVPSETQISTDMKSATENEHNEKSNDPKATNNNTQIKSVNATRQNQNKHTSPTDARKSERIKLKTTKSSNDTVDSESITDSESCVQPLQITKVKSRISEEEEVVTNVFKKLQNKTVLAIRNNLSEEDNPPAWLKLARKNTPTKHHWTNTPSPASHKTINSDDIDYVSDREMTIDDIKIEPVDWTREEDKIILETIKENIPESDRVENILNVLEENEVYEELLEKLYDKSKEDVEERINYLLEILFAEKT